MYYGNSTCSSQQNVAGTWDSNYIGVYHLNETGTGTRNDSTSNNNDLSTSGYENDEATSNGKIDGADDFDGNNDSLKKDTADYDGNATVELWTKMGSTGQAQWTAIFASSDDGGLSESFQFDLDGSNNYRIEESASNHLTLGGASITQFSYLAYKVDSNNGAFTFLNGSQVDSDASVTAANIDVHKIGVNRGTSLYYDGIIDEVRISNLARSAAWITTSYNTMQNTTTFVTSSSEESWMQWDNATQNPDTGSPWQWSFDFPNSTGYYEFYSIGKKAGGTDETAPNTADAICQYYIQNINISVTPETWHQGTVTIGDTNETTGFYFNVSNDGDTAIDVQIKAGNATNATTLAEWKLNASADHNKFALQFNRSDAGTWTGINTSYDTFKEGITIGGYQTFDLKIFFATTSTKHDPLELTITLKSVVS
jgi:hypothetical protein